MKKITIAIDGHSSSGKSTMAKDLAKTIGYTYIDTGAMYRAVTLYGLQQGLFSGDTLDEERLREEMKNIHISFRPNPETGRPDTLLNGVDVEKDIRGMEVSNHVSPVAALDFVRYELVEQQKKMGRGKGVVMDGRDVGTVIFPDAELKVFITASPEVRARRRLDELQGKGLDVSYEEILENVKKRDFIDSTREVGPLKQAEDAILLDNSNMSLEEQKAWLLEQYEKIMNYEL
ncbi:cytidylate kinase [Parabacteroides sp. PFB2-10]|uniref:(d)CMP kinase n=1 Tax=Parabacteroides sp. PFB2-10 TaxID=1742405 RepID=UPI00247610E3|nr:(d)CMP kinase [Parabacteroides sp. PFB2-10]MDH6312776.1 cytidylate kinase [Parabacteroides sp. PFB2-10]